MILDRAQENALDYALAKFLFVGVEAGEGLFIDEILDYGHTIVLTSGVEYFLQEVDESNLRYFPEEQWSDYDMIDVWLDTHMILYGS